MRREWRERDKEIRVLNALRDQPCQSLQDLAIETHFARCTVYGIIRSLEVQQRLRKIPGRGKIPNTYEFL